MANFDLEKITQDILDGDITYKKLVLFRLAYGIVDLSGKAKAQQAMVDLLNKHPALQPKLAAFFNGKTAQELADQFTEIQNAVAADSQYGISGTEQTLIGWNSTTPKEVLESLEYYKKNNLFTDARVAADGKLDLSKYILAPPAAPPTVASSDQSWNASGVEEPSEEANAAAAQKWAENLMREKRRKILEQLVPNYKKPLIHGDIDIIRDKKIVDYMVDGILRADDSDAANIRMGAARDIAERVMLSNPTLADESHLAEVKKLVEQQLPGVIRDFVTHADESPEIRDRLATAFFKNMDAAFQRAPGSREPAAIKDLKILAKKDYTAWLQTSAYAYVEEKLTKDSKQEPRTPREAILQFVERSTNPKIKALREEYLPLVHKTTAEWVAHPDVSRREAYEGWKKDNKTDGLFGGFMSWMAKNKIGQKVPEHKDYRPEIIQGFFNEYDKKITQGLAAVGLKKWPPEVKKQRDDLYALAKSDYTAFLDQEIGAQQVLAAVAHLKTGETAYALAANEKTKPKVEVREKAHVPPPQAVSLPPAVPATIVSEADKQAMEERVSQLSRKDIPALKKKLAAENARVEEKLTRAIRENDWSMQKSLDEAGYGWASWAEGARTGLIDGIIRGGNPDKISEAAADPRRKLQVIKTSKRTYHLNNPRDVDALRELAKKDSKTFLAATLDTSAYVAALKKPAEEIQQQIASAEQDLKNLKTQLATLQPQPVPPPVAAPGPAAPIPPNAPIAVASSAPPPPAQAPIRLVSATASDAASLKIPHSGNFATLRQMNKSAWLKHLRDSGDLWRYMRSIQSMKDGHPDIRISRAELLKFQRELKKAKFHDNRGREILDDGGVGHQMYEIVAKLREETGSIQDRINKDQKITLKKDDEYGPTTAKLAKKAGINLDEETITVAQKNPPPKHDNRTLTATR